jgi:hypothetical protein
MLPRTLSEFSFIDQPASVVSGGSMEEQFVKGWLKRLAETCTGMLPPICKSNIDLAKRNSCVWLGRTRRTSTVRNVSDGGTPAGGSHPIHLPTVTQMLKIYRKMYTYDEQGVLKPDGRKAHAVIHITSARPMDSQDSHLMARKLLLSIRLHQTRN